MMRWLMEKVLKRKGILRLTLMGERMDRKLEEIEKGSMKGLLYMEKDKLKDEKGKGKKKINREKGESRMRVELLKG